MLRSVSILSLVVVSLTSFSQEVIFDHIHEHDGAIYLTEQNGEEVLLDAHGHELQLHDVFRMSMEDIKQNGWGNSITAEGRAGKRNDDGPTFNLTYLDQVNGTGVGFDDPNLGAERRAALEAAFAYYASVIEDYGSADIEIRESFSANPMSNPFGYSAAYYFGSKGFNQPFTKAHITSGNDPYGPYPDGYIQFNFHPNLNYNYVVNANPGQDQYDFYTIALHEILHLLGFTSYATASGESAASEDVFTSFDGFLAGYNKDALFLVSGSGPTTEVATPEDGALTNNQVWFELYEGQHAPVFSPNPFSGSSLDHFDNGRSDHGEYLMHPSLTNGDAFKLLHEDEVRVLEQLGYTVNYSIATSIDEHVAHEAPAKVRSGLYPNPAFNSEPVQIELGDVDANEVLVIVYDMMGRESYSKVILNRGAGPVTAIDPNNNLTPGMYIVIGSTDDELFNEKLVIR
jgi:hypothetical protein